MRPNRMAIERAYAGTGWHNHLLCVVVGYGQLDDYCPADQLEQTIRLIDTMCRLQDNHDSLTIGPWHFEICVDLPVRVIRVYGFGREGEISPTAKLGVSR